jgi:hypothetical protein
VGQLIQTLKLTVQRTDGSEVMEATGSIPSLLLVKSLHRKWIFGSYAKNAKSLLQGKGLDQRNSSWSLSKDMIYD